MSYSMVRRYVSDREPEILAASGKASASPASGPEPKRPPRPVAPWGGATGVQCGAPAGHLDREFWRTTASRRWWRFALLGV